MNDFQQIIEALMASYMTPPEVRVDEMQGGQMMPSGQSRGRMETGPSFSPGLDAMMQVKRAQKENVPVTPQWRSGGQW